MIATRRTVAGDYFSLSHRVEELSAAPVFIIGAPRSGTTWLQRILLCHDQVCGGQESQFFQAAAGFCRLFDTVPHSNRVVGLPAYWDKPEMDQAMLSLWRRTMQPLIESCPQATVLIEKTPDHAMYIPLILELLPRARFIHIIRDSRAVVASLLAASKTWARSWAPSNPKDAALYWCRYVTTARRDGRALDPHQYTELHYEDLSADPVVESKRMFDFIGLDVSATQLASIVESQRFDEQKAINGSPIPAVVDVARRREPEGFFRSGKTDSWRTDLSRYEKFVVWRFTRKLMAELGYTWAGRRSDQPAR